MRVQTRARVYENINMYKYATITILLAIVTPNFSLPYPSHGGARYHHADSGGDGGIGQKSKASLTAYGKFPQYDDRYVSNVGGGGNSRLAQYPSYQDDGEYNIIEPRKPNMYTIYGMPTYRGEYKPSSYYYSQMPSFNYYEDRVENSNPLDDLHEEMIQEHERDRLRHFAMGQEQWYEPVASAVRRPPKVTNEFLQNLMAYNKQMGGSDVASLTHDPELDSFSQEFDQDEDYYGEDTMPSVGANDPQAPFDYRSYENFNQRYNAHLPHQQLQQLPQQKPRPIYRERVNEDHDDVGTDEGDDEDVRELKSLANRGRGKVKHHSEDSEFSQGQRQFESNTGSSDWRKDITGGESDPIEYDDSAWINWDRKRSVPQKQRENIKLLALNEQKVVENSNVPQIHLHPTAVNVVQSMTSPSLKGMGNAAAPMLPSSTTAAPADYLSALSRLIQGGSHQQHHRGQKEVLLPRPDTPARHPFSAPVLNMLQQNSEKTPKSSDDNGSSKDIYDTIKKIVHMEDKINQVR